MRRRLLISIFVFSFLTLLYSVLFVALMLNFEGKRYTLIDGLYWVLTTVTTVGYGDIHFTSVPGKLFSIVVMVSGVLFFFGFFIPYVVIPWAEQRLLIVLPTEIKNLERHLVICGYNRFTRELCSILNEFGMRYVVMELKPEKVREAIENNVQCVLTDNSAESFNRNNVKDAVAVVIAWEDVESVIDTLLALKGVDIRKYVIHGDQRYTRYFLFAGAEKVFLPKSLIAATIARTILGEVQIGRLNRVLGDIYTAELLVPRKMEIRSLETKGLKVVAVCRAGQLEFNPPSDKILEKGCVVLVAGNRKAVEEVVHEGSHLRIR